MMHGGLFQLCTMVLRRNRLSGLTFLIPLEVSVFTKKDLFMDIVGAVLFLINLIEARGLFQP